MPINKRERNLLVITIGLVVVLVSYFLIASLLASWQSVGHVTVQKQKEFNAETNFIARVPDWQSEYDKLGHSLTKSSNFEKISDVLKKIEEVSTAAGVRITSNRSLKPEEHDVYREWPVQCGFEATTDSLVKFLNGLQTSTGFMTVEQLNVTPRPDNPSILRCDIQIRALAAKGGRTAS